MHGRNEADVGNKTVENTADEDDMLLQELNEERTDNKITSFQEEFDHDLTRNENKSMQERKQDASQDESHSMKEAMEDLKQDKNNPLQEVKEVTSDNINIILEEKEVSLEGTDVAITNNATDNTRTKKKEITWEDKDYLKTVNLQEIDVRSYAWTVERKASIGPYFQSTPSFGGPSGITICIPKKSRKGIHEDLNTMPSVINITVSKKSIVNRSISRSNNEHGKNKLDLKIGDAPNATFFGALRGRIHDIRDKIRNTLNI